MFRQILLAAVLYTSAASLALAGDWLNVLQKDDFDGKHRYMAISSAKDPFLAFICDAETARIRLLFNTGTKPGRFARKSMPIWPSWVAVIIDDQPALSYPGKVDKINDRLVFESYDGGITDFGKRISAAQRRVLIAIDLGGEKYFRNEFAVTGSGAAIKKLFDMCDKLRAKRG